MQRYRVEAFHHHHKLFGAHIHGMTLTTNSAGALLNVHIIQKNACMWHSRIASLILAGRDRPNDILVLFWEHVQGVGTFQLRSQTFSVQEHHWNVKSHCPVKESCITRVEEEDPTPKVIQLIRLPTFLRQSSISTGQKVAHSPGFMVGDSPLVTTLPVQQGHDSSCLFPKTGCDGYRVSGSLYLSIQKWLIREQKPQEMLSAEMHTRPSSRP